VRLALEASVEQLVLFHHKPERSDDEVDACLAQCRGCGMLAPSAEAFAAKAAERAQEAAAREVAP
jgi:hypothetical protein